MQAKVDSTASLPLHRMHPLICQLWVESDEGFPRPWGYTIHLSEDDCRRFREEFWRNQRAELGEAVPSSYVREAGEMFMVGATAEVVDTLELLSKRGVCGAWGMGDTPSKSGVEKVSSPQDFQDEDDPGTIAERFAVLRDPLVIKACTTAAADFASKPRKVPRGSGLEAKPFFSHLQTVALLLAESGYGPEVVAAGYLHDHLEDLPELWNKRKLSSQFGQQVAELVGFVTHQADIKSWSKRSELYRQNLRSGPAEAFAISAADKISNIEDALIWLRAGYPLQSLLRKGWQENSEKFHELLQMFKGVVHPRLVQRLTDALDEFDRLGPAVERKAS